MEEQPSEVVNRALAALRDAVEGHDELFTALGDALAGRDAEWQAAMTVQTDQAAGLQADLTAAVEAYRRLMVAGDPVLAGEELTGGSVAAIDAEAERIRAMAARVRTLALEEVARAVSAGAPGRTPPDLAALSPREKIALGVQHRLQGQ